MLLLHYYYCIRAKTKVRIERMLKRMDGSDFKGCVHPKMKSHSKGRVGEML